MNQGPTGPPSPSMVKVVALTLLWLLMGFFAIIGPFFVVLAGLSFFFDLSPYLSMTLLHGEPVQAPQQKALFLAVGALLALLGISFFWLRRRGYFRDAV